jgi:hypothetical protein
MAARQRWTVQGRISNGTLFPNICFALESQLSSLAKNVLTEAKAHFTGILDFIRSDLEMILDARPDPVAARDEAAVEQFKQTLDGLKARQDEVLQSVRDICPMVQ